MDDLTLTELLEAGVHFGHQSQRWNPKAFPYIFSERNGIHIIDLVQTTQLLKYAYKYLYNESRNGGEFLFVGTKPQAAKIVAQEAQKCSSHYVNQRWLGGLLTNWETLQKRVSRLKYLEEMHETGELSSLPKKEAAVLIKELQLLGKNLDGIKNMKALPSAVIIVDQKREKGAVVEARKLGIPVVSLCDTNCDPDLIDILIPANDDAVSSIQLILNKLSDAIRLGKSEYVEKEMI
jgi:small subunit ribosomal protein S2